MRRDSKMSIVLTCGHELSGYNLVHESLIKIGLSEAFVSKQEEFSPSVLISKMCKAHGLSNAQISQVEPGKFWHSLASDLFRVNMDQQSWGWADSDNIYFLNFWKNFDPQIRFVLVYSSPEVAVAQALLQETPCRETVLKILEEWAAYNRELVRFYQNHKNRCVLVNLEAISKNFYDFKTLLNGRVDQSSEFIDTNNVSLDVVSSQATLIGNILVQDANEQLGLYQDLEAIADLPFFSGKDLDEIALESWDDYRDVRKQVNQLQGKLLGHDELSGQNKQLRLQSKKIKSERLGQKGLDPQSGEVGVNIASETKVEELTRENELLLLQLHQVQEELELYFKKYKSLSSKKEADVGGAQNVSSGLEKHGTILDLRHFIDGQNWHHAEHDGRWSGPGTSSSIKLPQLNAGKYCLEMHIVGAMVPDIIRRVVLLWRGEELQIKTLQPWRGLKAFLRRYYLLIFKNREGGPLILKTMITVPANISDDDKMLQIEIPRTISPVSRGENDTRDLGFKLSQIKISPIQ